MNDPTLTATSIFHVVYGHLRQLDTSDGHSDRGAVSIEQVLWYAAAAVSVAVVATIIWNTVRDSANDVSPVNGGLG